MATSSIFAQPTPPQSPPPSSTASAHCFSTLANDVVHQCGGTSPTSSSPPAALFNSSFLPQNRPTNILLPSSHSQGSASACQRRFPPCSPPKIANPNPPSLPHFHHQHHNNKLGGPSKKLLKSRAQSDLAPLMKAGQRLSRQDPSIRRLMAEQNASGGNSGASSPSSSSKKQHQTQLLGPIQEHHSPPDHRQEYFSSYDTDLPDLQGSNGDLLDTMRSRSGTIDSAGSRRRQARGVSVNESEIIRVLAGGCESCHSLLMLHQTTSKPRVSNITFSTVTSATGLPTIAAEPSRPRSSSYWKPLAASQPQHSPHIGGTSQSAPSSAPSISNSHHNNLKNNNNSSSIHYNGGNKQQRQINNWPEQQQIHGRNNELLENGDEEDEDDNSLNDVLNTENNEQTKKREQLQRRIDGGGETAPKLTAAKLVASSDGSSAAATAGIRQTAAATVAPRPDNNATTAHKQPTMTGQPKSGLKSSPNTQMSKSRQKPPPYDHSSRRVEPSQPSSTELPPSSHSHPAVLPEEECCCSDQSSSTSNGSPEDSLVYKTVDSTTFDRAELERDPKLKQIQAWSFPIFQFAEKHNKTVLTRLSYAIFKEANLFRTFKISYAKFFNYFHALESGYWDIPYHNRIHAADVLHGCYYLTCHPVHPFCCFHSEMHDEEEEEDEERQTNENDGSYVNNCCDEKDNVDSKETSSRGNGHHHGTYEIGMATAAPLAQSMSPLELMALYTAATMHDYDHPGRTNAFLVASEDRKAILYNDRSVLENHHAAESWRLLTSQSQNHFIENLDSAEMKRFRYLVLEYILATDLKQHFDIIMQFNERAPDVDLANESDRVLVSLMLIKFADINSPTKPYSLHRQWTERICQEFYEQGDEEKIRHMAISPYMDRNEPSVSKLQDSFIAHIVNPLAVALNEAGLLPILPGLPESELIINLKHNHQKWLQQIELDGNERDQKQQQQRQKSIEEEPTKISTKMIKAEGKEKRNNNSNNHCSLMISATTPKNPVSFQ